MSSDHGLEGEVPLSSACFAPHSALYLRPDGLVHACCVTGFSIGSVWGPERQSLREIWEGAALATQRRALEDGSFDLGCQECEWVADSGGRDASLPVHFDRFATGAPHPFPKLLDLALSSRCNLQCVMCNGGLSSAIRTQREGLPPLPDCYDDRFFEELDEFLPHVERFQFKGGEPFLARENRRIWDRLIELGLEPEVTVTTNGTIFNDDVARYVRELRMHPNISIDGMRPETLEAIRVGVEADKLWRNIDRFQELAEVAGNGMTLSYCLINSNWREVLPFLAEADRRELNCNVIVVNQPSQYDLLRLPHEELTEVFQQLCDADPQFAGAAPRQAWNEVLERLRSHLEHPVALVVNSDVTPMLESRPVDRGTQEVLRASLAQEFGIEPLEVEADGGIVQRVTDPEWATWLGARGFVGRPIDSLGDVIEASVGPLAETWAESPVADVVVIVLDVDSPDGRRSLMVHRLVDAESGQHRVFVVQTDGPPPVSGPADPGRGS
jgi:molybdenum cofactor biosynthesis enzyme MoaA